LIKQLAAKPQETFSATRRRNFGFGQYVPQILGEYGGCGRGRLWVVPAACGTKLSAVG